MGCMEAVMPERGAGRGVRSWAWAVCAAAVWACGSGASGSGESEPANASESDVDGAPESTRDVRGADGVTYQMVETADGVTMEAVTSSEVQSVSCPTRTCAGLCDECALRACQAAGELAAACERLVSDCNGACTCDVQGFGAGSCGLPVCATNRNLCYIEPGVDPRLPTPVDPEPDPSPVSPIDGASNPSNAGTPAPNGAGAAQPAG